jgi:hypothetical protein
MKRRPHPFCLHVVCCLLLVTFALAGVATADSQTQSPEKSVSAPRGQTISVKMIGPVTQTTDLQVICVLQHDPAGDQYIEAMSDFNSKLGGLLSSIRDRGEFAGDLGETLLFTPPANTITPKQVLLIGVGAEKELTLDKLKLAGRIAAREAIRLKASHVSFAPTLRDQGSSRIDVGEGDAAVVTGWLMAYDTEKRLQDQNLSPRTDVTTFVIEAGPKYFDSAFEKIGGAVREAAAAIDLRPPEPFILKK